MRLVVDTSAIVALFQREALTSSIQRALEQASIVEIAAPTYVETGTVLAGRQPRGPRVALARLDAFIAATRIVIVPFDAQQARAAVEARIRFGKGLGGPGKLNLGDTYAYALAKVRDAPLLFIGDDFAQTDIASALA